MSLGSFLQGKTMWLGLAMVGGFVLWKFVLEPIMNEGKPIEPTEDDIKTFGEKLQENINTDVNL